MRRDVTMPQLGMAQDAGKIVSWLKAQGDAVAKGDALFEVETDKATMEVEAQASGFLTRISAAEGEDVPVGAVIAQISDSAEGDAVQEADTPAPAPEPSQQADQSALPEGHAVTMPQLGMAQDSGLLVNWLKALGDPVATDDLLFEVETDKSTMEVTAGRDGYLAATLAEAGDEVPVGDRVAIISTTKPDAPVARSQKSDPQKSTPADAAQSRAKEQAKTADAAPSTKPAKPAQPIQKTDGGRVLASPKLRRVALEQGLDLERLAATGHPQPFHMRDLDALRALPDRTAVQTQSAGLNLTAKIPTEGFAGFASWAAEAHGLKDGDALLAGLAGASLGAPCVIAVERFGQSRRFDVPANKALSGVTADTSDSPPALILRDLRSTALVSLAMGAAEQPVLTLMSDIEGGATLTLECGPEQLDAQAAITLLTTFAGRMEHPLHHLL